MSDRVAVVTIARGRRDHLALQHLSLARGTVLPDPYLVVSMGDEAITPTAVEGLTSRVVHIDADPRALPLAAARNLGATEALAAGADVVVFVDVDCVVAPDLVAGYRTRCSLDRDAVWSGPVTYLPPPGTDGYRLDALIDDPHPARPSPQRGEWCYDRNPDLFWSLSFALHREAWRRSGGFCELYSGYGGEDTDFAATCQREGLRFGWTGDARAYHQHHPVSRPPVEHLDDILRNAGTFYERWGRWPMLGWLEAFEDRGLIVKVENCWRRAPAHPSDILR
ncbi:glycosyltransferase [Nocardioides salsibiostraticola]